MFDSADVDAALQCGKLIDRCDKFLDNPRLRSY